MFNHPKAPLRETIIASIAASNLSEAIRLTIRLCSDDNIYFKRSIILSMDWHQLEDELQKGSISGEKAAVQRRKLALAILDIILGGMQEDNNWHKSTLPD